MTAYAPSNPAERAARLARLRGQRDLDVVRALIERPELDLQEVADTIEMSVNNLKTRLQKIFLVLDVSSRLELYASYHGFYVSCDCRPRPDSSDEKDSTERINE